MAARKVHGGQIEIPTGDAIGSKHDDLRRAVRNVRRTRVASSSGTGREYPPELVHGELCATRFGANAECDCGKSKPAASSGTGHDAAPEPTYEEWCAAYVPLAERVPIAAPARAEECPTLQFLDDVRTVVTYHWSGLPEKRPAESVWARLDAVLFDDFGISRVQPDYTADPNATGAPDA